ncbi:MAG: hypothetical protein ABI723_01185 [Bacteroidia bacterium]
MKDLSLIVLLFFICFEINAQQTLLVDEQSIRLKEEQIKSLGDSILKGTTDEIRVNANNELKSELKMLLQSPNTFNYSFDSLKNISKVKSDDDRVRIFTWILPTDTGTHYSYCGLIQYRNPKKKIFKLIELKEDEIDSASLLKKSFKADKWFGALYYKIIETKNKKTVYYTLLGWKGNNKQTTKKVIDVLTFNNDEAQLGAPVLQFEKHIQSRIVFEYNAEVSMLLHWDEHNHAIVFDHLAPANIAFKNQMQTYGPNFQYDELKWRKGKWNYAHDVDVRNSNDVTKEPAPNKKKREFYAPEK